jgi:hypothetical protein
MDYNQHRPHSLLVGCSQVNFVKQEEIKQEKKKLEITYTF